jgi:hypothetical protein
MSSHTAQLARISLNGNVVTQKVNKRGGGACEPLGRLHGMPVGRSWSKVRSPFSLLLSLETVICPLAPAIKRYCSSLDDRAIEHSRLLQHSYPKGGWGHGPATHEEREWTTIFNTTSYVAFRMKILGRFRSGGALAGLEWISPFDFSLEAPPNPWRPPVGPRGPRKGPNEDREQPRGV